MPRDGNGTYYKPVGTSAVSGQAIKSAAYNNLTTDLGNEITNSLPRNGEAPMTGPLVLSGPPTLDLHAADKKYIDDETAVLTALINAQAVAAASWQSVASSATVDLEGQSSRNIVLTGTTTISSFGATAKTDYLPYFLRAESGLTLTHSANLLCPGGVDLPLLAGDIIIVTHDTTTQPWRVLNWFPSQQTRRYGTSANNALALDASAKIPAVDASQLTNLPPNGVGVGQTWQNPTRSIGTTYTNSTTKSIQVNVAVSLANSADVSFLVVGGIIVGQSQIAGTAANGSIFSMSAIVPPGAGYYVTGGSLRQWAELR